MNIENLIKPFKEQIEKQAKVISAQTKQIKELTDLVNEELEESVKLYEKIDRLEATIKKQSAIIDAFKGERKPPKNSTNSDIPPSKDIGRKNRRRSLREKSGKKPGGQKGHQGHTLEFVEQPDQQIDYFPESCVDCKKKLDPRLAELFKARQVRDIPPPPKPIITQHNTYKIPCHCGCVNKAEFPEYIKGYTQYGPNICALVNYLNVRHFMPYDRTVELFKDCFNLKMSKGTIANMLRKTAKKAIPTYLFIKEQIKKSDVVGSDETIIFVNAIRKIVWCWQTDKFTYLKATESRKAIHIKEEFPDGFPNAVLVSDQYAAQLNTPAIAHQSCIPHIDRKLKYLLEIQKSEWVKRMRQLFYDAIALKKEKKVIKYRGAKRIKKIESELNSLLLLELKKDTHPDILKIQRTLVKYRDTLLTFMFYENVPWHNNASEQTFRCLKVKINVSGSFKKLQQEFVVIRSIIDTTIKHKLNILQTLALIEKGNLISFGLPTP